MLPGIVPTTVAETGPLPRRRSALAFADIVGWSVVTGADEVLAVARWTAMLRDTVAPAAARGGGRIVDVQGDGTLAEFPDAGAALDWALALHTASAATEAATPDQPPIAFRIAIHVGTVMVEGDRIFGDAVNVAARLQDYGTPGGTVLSAEAAAALPGERTAGARDLGALPLRNLSRSVRALSLDPARRVAVPLPPPPTLLPSVAVLPLENALGDPAQDYLAAGVVDDVAASLAGLHEVFVIAPESARMFAYQSATPQRVGRTLGVRYVVTGSMRRAGGGFLASVRLSDTLTGEQLWGERIEAADREVFDVQEHVVAQIVAGVAPNIRAAALREALRKRPESLTAYDWMLRGVHEMAAPDSAGLQAARGHLERAMEIDPGFALPRAWAAHWHNICLAAGLSANRAADIDRLFALAGEALSLDPRNSLALGVLGHNTSFIRRDYELGWQHLENALRTAPGNAMAWTFAGGTLSYLGRGREAVEHAQRGIRLSPYDSLRFYKQHFLSIAQYVAGDMDRAEKTCRVSIGANPGHAPAWRMLAAVLGGAGKLPEARQAMRRLLALEPDFSLKVYGRERVPFGDHDRERFLADLKAAGAPT